MRPRVVAVSSLALPAPARDVSSLTGRRDAVELYGGEPLLAPSGRWGGGGVKEEEYIPHRIALLYTYTHSN